MKPVRFQDAARHVRRDGFHPFGGVSCGTVTGAPIPKRVIAARFLNAVLSNGRLFWQLIYRFYLAF